MTVNFPDVGPNRRWNLTERSPFPYNELSPVLHLRLPTVLSEEDEENTYVLLLEEFVPGVPVEATVTIYRRNWFGKRTPRTEKSTRQSQDYWKTLDSIYVWGLETEELLAAADKVLASVAKRELAKSRLGTYPPKTLD